MNRMVLVVVLVALGTTACERPGTTEASAPIGDVRDATLELASGADTVTVRSEDLGDDLFRASTTDDAVARVERDGDVVRVHLDDDIDDDDDAAEDGADGGPAWNPPWDDGRGDRDGATVETGDTDADEIDDTDAGGGTSVEIRLSSRVNWTVRLIGGAKVTTVDMSAGEVAGVEFAGGVSHIRLALPAPEGTIPVTMLGGASEFDVTVPAGVPARVRLGSGAGSVTVDGATRTGVAQGTVLTTPAWESASDRYDIDAIAGVSRLTVAGR